MRPTRFDQLFSLGGIIGVAGFAQHLTQHPPMLRVRGLRLSLLSQKLSWASPGPSFSPCSCPGMCSIPLTSTSQSSRRGAGWPNIEYCASSARERSVRRPELLMILLPSHLHLASTHFIRQIMGFVISYPTMRI